MTTTTISTTATKQEPLNKNNLTQRKEKAPPINCLPDEIFLSHVLPFLNIQDLKTIPLVCKKWRAVIAADSFWKTLNLKKLFPSITIYNETGFDNKLPALEIQSLHRRSFINFLESLPLEIVEGGLGWTVLILPEGFTIDLLTTKLKSSIKFAGYPKEYLEKFVIEKTCTLAITNNIVKGSRNINFKDQKQLAEKYNCKISDLLSTAALGFLTLINSKEDSSAGLFKDRTTYARCSDKVHGFHLLLGSQSSNEFYCNIDDNEVEEEEFGCVFIRQFS